MRGRGLRVVASNGGERSRVVCVGFPPPPPTYEGKKKKKIFLIKTTHGEANEDFVWPALGLLNHFLLFRCV